eukprot:13550318-Alexandrium_andersonii.AAC.1
MPDDSSPSASFGFSATPGFFITPAGLLRTPSCCPAGRFRTCWIGTGRRHAGHSGRSGHSRAFGALRALRAERHFRRPSGHAC